MNMATSKQTFWINQMMSEKDVPAELQRTPEQAAQMTTKDASTLLGQLFKLPKTSKAVVTKPALDSSKAKVGIYLIGFGEDEKIVAVVPSKHNSAHRYAKMLIANAHKPVFKYVSGLISEVIEGAYQPMTYEQAEKLSLNLKYCICCGRKLEVHESKQKGIGPVCAKKFF